MIDPIQRLRDEFPFFESIGVGLQFIRTEVSGFGAAIREVTHDLEPIFAGAAEVAQAVRALPERIRSQLETLGEHGWFLDLEMEVPELFEIAELFAAGQATEANERLVSHYERDLLRIQDRLNSGHPDRIQVFGDAFDAHREGRFTLSVPVFLTQAEGVCFDLTNRSLYSKIHSKSVASFIERTNDETFASVFRHALALRLPIKGGDGGDLPGVLNRHSVLHGESTDYGTRVNSCKAISLLLHCSQVLCQQRLKDDEDN